MKLSQILGLTNYLFGKDHFASYAKFKLQRYFVDNFRVTQVNLDFRTQPTWQNFKHDELLANAKANGQFNIWCTQGAFDWQGVQGKQGKVMPIRDADNPMDQNSWKDIGHTVRQIAIRYADDTAHLLSEAKAFQGSPTYLSNTPKAGLNLVDAIEIQNEWDFKQAWSGATRTITPEQYAVCFKVCYDSIRSVSKTMRIVMGGGISPIESTFTRFLTKLKELYAAEGKPMPTDFYLCFHWYMRNGSQDQGGGTAGITPEEAKAYGFGLMMDSLCQAHGLPGWYCTETGWATDDSKQSAPILEGFTREQSQGILMIRLALIWGACKYHNGISFWHVRDDYDQPPYAKGGVNYKDWTAKPARTICEEFLEKYGEMEVSGFRHDNGAYSVYLPNDDVLIWTDKKNDGNATPMPQLIDTLPEPPQPTTMNLTVLNKQFQWSDGQPCDLVHADSPESRLHPSYKAQFSAECKALPTFGINAITVTMRGDDVTAISPWLNNTPSQGVDVAKLQTWHTQLKEFLDECEKNGLRGVVIAYLGERTNFKSITDQQYENWFIEMGKIFQDISGQIIFGWEEIWDGSDSNTMRYCDTIGSLLKSYLPNSLLMYHNNPGQKAFNVGSSFVKVVCIQETSISAMKATAQAALAKGFAVHFHELYGQVKLSNTQDANKKIVTDLCAAAMSIGVKNVGIFANDYDLQAPDASKLSYLYKHLSQTLNGTNPNPMARKIFITTGTVANYDLATELTEGENVPLGSYALYVDGEPPVTLSVIKENGTVIIPERIEGAKPLAFGGDDNGKLRPLALTQGFYVVKVSGQADLRFTVGTTAPPPVDIKGVSFALKPDGKIEFTFEGGTKKLVSPT